MSESSPPILPADPVDALIADRAHPLGATVSSVRAVLQGIPGVVESVKWNSPNYALNDDFATLNLRRDTAIQVILHTGAKAKPEHSEIVIDPVPPFARWADRNRLIVTLRGAEVPAADAEAFAAAVRSWVSQLE